MAVAKWVDSDTYKDFAIVIAKCDSERGEEFRGRAQNLSKFPNGLEADITFDSSVHRDKNSVYRELFNYIDQYRNVN